MVVRTGSGWLGRIGVFAGVLLLGAASSPAKTKLSTVVVASGLSQPVFVATRPGDSSRLYVVELPGVIRVVEGGVAAAQPFLDLTAMLATGGERGIFSIAFHPLFTTNRFVYVCYTALPDGALTVERYVADADGLTADPASVLPILSIPATSEFHHGGNLAFNPLDGYLYVGVGDGQEGADPDNNAQNLSSMRGKILRIDVDAPAGGLNYGIPPTNPFAGAIPGADEIWALGVRNPWRLSFDAETGDLWIGDVGEGTNEEVDVLPFGAPGGANLGWRCMEGLQCHPFLESPECMCSMPSLIPPVFSYAHTDGCAVMGGFVYRGSAIPDLKGTFFFADFCKSSISSFRYKNGVVSNLQDRTEELQIPDLVHNPSSFGVDGEGELYLVFFSGTVLKIVADSNQPMGASGSGGGCR